jgi:hypothetical protein
MKYVTPPAFYTVGRKLDNVEIHDHAPIAVWCSNVEPCGSLHDSQTTPLSWNIPLLVTCLRCLRGLRRRPLLPLRACFTPRSAPVRPLALFAAVSWCRRGRFVVSLASFVFVVSLGVVATYVAYAMSEQNLTSGRANSRPTIPNRRWNRDWPRTHGFEIAPRRWRPGERLRSVLGSRPLAAGSNRLSARHSWRRAPSTRVRRSQRQRTTRSHAVRGGSQQPHDRLSRGLHLPSHRDALARRVDCDRARRSAAAAGGATNAVRSGDERSVMGLQDAVRSRVVRGAPGRPGGDPPTGFRSAT